ncbi:MAG: hypothetical protein H6707_01845 [Deltaproteobacteria bacterium]|nr:hypothetical protein [Deltaproteobacteria bacterium]
MTAHAKYDPLRGITAGQLRADVAIVVDVSRSMLWPIASSPLTGSCGNGVCNSNESDISCPQDCSAGSDCLGDRSAGATPVDVCGDGYCSGAEDNTSCPADCLINFKSPLSGTSISPGSAPKCGQAKKTSRLAVVKRALRNILPELRTVARFSLISFAQTRLRAVPAPLCREQTPAYYTYHQADTSSSKLVSLFLSEWELRLRGGWNGASGPQNFTWLAGGSASGAALTLESGANSIYRLSEDPATEVRLPYVGGTVEHNGESYQYVGSYFSYRQYAMLQGPADPEVRHFADYRGPQFSEAGVTWVHRRHTGFAVTTMLANQVVTPTLVYCGGLSTVGELVNDLQRGAVLQPFLPATDQASQDAVLGQLMTQFNVAEQGGLIAHGGTPLGEALDTARVHFLDRQAGSWTPRQLSSTFVPTYVGPSTAPTGWAADAAAPCRPRFVLLLTDGESNGPLDPATATTNLYSTFCPSPDNCNPVRVLPIGMPGANMTELDKIADISVDGVDDPDSCTDAKKCPTARFANNEAELVRAVKEALFEILRGDYTTASAGVTTGVDSQITGNVAVVASTEYPGWRGQLRGYDFSKPDCNTDPTSCIEWDAGAQLEARDWKTRKLYTGAAGHNSGIPFALFDSAGTVNVSAIRQVWSTTATNAQISAFIDDLAGKNGWKLSAIFRAMPTSWGPPTPMPKVPSHAALESAQRDRQRLIYVGSNDGILHAFDTTGKEVFGYIAPHHLAKIYAIYQQGGQDPDPNKYQWVLANSPRIGDLAKSSADPSSWRTFLVQTSGPGSEDFYVLDVTSPTTCTTAGQPATCSLASPPFKVAFNSKTASPSIDPTFGETWSLPALYWSGALAYSQMAMGSGYGTSDQGEYYNRLIYSGEYPWYTTATLSSKRLAGAGALVSPYAVMADTVVGVDDSTMQAVNAYQADLNGRITTFNSGDPNADALILGDNVPSSTAGAGSSYPFYYAPAALREPIDNSRNFYLTAASGSYFEDTPAGATSTIFSFKHRGFSSTTDNHFRCAIDQVCSASCYVDTPPPCPDGHPSNRATPIDRPMMVNNLTKGRIESFYLYYDPPTAQCSGNEPAVGSTWLIRLEGGDADSFDTPKLTRVRRYDQKIFSGLTLIGGGTDIVLTKVGKNTAASAQTGSGKVVSVNAGGKAMIESWLEVR